ncbi:T9SS type A sorting domain-containing protein [Nibribacter ruber]|uniref:T9SS type A sorting domain-containing protein n=1 Tax=Nibribacter ruber TaxID=2698458 RepID=A0A6P1P2H0_9BACT|nr:T9SS type A sorting domain-containing protein [Nibribacter ruber]QHL88580.1 T9SS type A sorting domain-containing protein [Nibribacter ruber]
MNPRLKVLGFLIICLSLAGQTSWAQTRVRFQETAGPVVKANDQPLRLPWAGGFNSPQFSSIDLNQDGQQDLFVFDRSSQKVSTFLAVQSNGQWQYQWAPQYAAAFPQDLKFFALLRDFNCDGAPDIFTASSQGFKVYTNTTSSGSLLSFDLTHPLLTYNDGVNLTVGSEDLPAISDMDGDGDLDILMWEWSGGTRLEYFQNQRAEEGLSCSAMAFTKAASQWGRVTRCAGNCNSYKFDAEACPSLHHVGGSSVLPLHLNSDELLDLVVGHDDCPDLVSLINTGTILTPKITSAERNLPPDITGNQFSVFPAAYYLDVTFDGLPDLVVAPNMTSNAHRNVDLNRSTWVYANTGTARHPRFQSPKQPFLQDQMLDVGEGASPALGDLDGDGDADLLIGNTALLKDGRYAASLSFYRNTGTAAEASFTLAQQDYLGFTVGELQNLKPQLLDIDQDGKVDLFWSAFNQTTSLVEAKYILNEAAPGADAQFSQEKSIAITGLNFFKGDVPYLADIDQDGVLDLLVGRNSGALTYYRNTGTNTARVWSLVTESLGGIAANVERKRLQVLFLDLNHDRQADLLTTDDSGTVRFYPSFQQHLTGTFLVEENLLWGGAQADRPIAFGSNLTLASADLKQDKYKLPELLLGTQAGGVRFLNPVPDPLGTGEGQASELSNLQLYPNPAASFTTLLSPRAVRFTLHNLEGRKVAQGEAAAQKATTLKTGHLPAGLYLLRVTSAAGSTATLKLVISK